LHPSQTGERMHRGLEEGAWQGMAARIRAARSPLPLHGQVALQFTFSVTHRCLYEMLPLVGLGLGARPRFDWELCPNALLAPDVRTLVPPIFLKFSLKKL
jgi:hypothetical protein